LLNALGDNVHRKPRTTASLVFMVFRPIVALPQREGAGADWAGHVNSLLQLETVWHANRLRSRIGDFDAELLQNDESLGERWGRPLAFDRGGVPAEIGAKRSFGGPNAGME